LNAPHEIDRVSRHQPTLRDAFLISELFQNGLMQGDSEGTAFGVDGYAGGIDQDAARAVIQISPRNGWI
jgi:hypothetical protein